ncbi:NlpC/P60 family protein [Pelagibacterium montanilacus]|uniref:NlpC/P60 family protein n=1 Tax=Pelagibacterium montanilacus TaxID=2185280 RepID=UPI000F8ED33D|nr:NlpC/P60 family protein [Pelagibacterium montanilacus]
MTGAADVAGLAKGWIGTPYRHQGAARGAGCDCLGLVRGIWRDLYGREAEPIPPYSPDWRRGDEGISLEAAAFRHLQPVEGGPEAGHVVLFRLSRRLDVRHCGVMSGQDVFVHAQEQVGVVQARLDARWRARLAGVFAFPPRR